MFYSPRRTLAKPKGDSLPREILHATSYKSKFESIRWLTWVSWRKHDLESWGWKAVGFINLCLMNTLHQYTRGSFVYHLCPNCETCSPISMSLEVHFLCVKSLKITWTLAVSQLWLFCLQVNAFSVRYSLPPPDKTPVLQVVARAC